LDKGGKNLISIITPCLNEEGNVISLFERINNALEQNKFELIYVNDGSTDLTKIQIQNLLRNNPENIRLVNHEHNLGITNAWVSGVKIAKGEYVCLIDADLQNPPESIPSLLLALEESQSDFAQGVRSSIGRVKDQRMFLSRSLNTLLNFFFLQNAKDSKSGFILGKTHLLKQTLDTRPEVKHFQTFLGVAVRSLGFRVVEVETLFQSRQVGSSFISGLKSIRISIEALLDFPKAFKRYRKKSINQISNIKFEPVPQDLSFFRKIRWNLFFGSMPLHKWIIRKPAKKYYSWLKSTEFASREKLELLQLERMQKLINHAYHHVPYYRSIFQETGIKPNDIKTLDDLHKIPLLNKQDVRNKIHFALFSDVHNKKEMLRINTSGSTGEPFVCYADKFQLEMRFATTLRALEMSGWKFGEKQLRLWHQTLGMNKSQIIREKIDSIFMRRKFIPAFEITDESVKKLINTINNFKPSLIDGYAESLNYIASLDSLNLEWKPKALMSSAQQLTNKTRASIEALFGAKVLDKYGSREFSGIAYQCLEGNFHHVQDESYIVELLVDDRPAQPGEIGEIVITDLNNFSVPLIRYRIGDLAKCVEQIPCHCGRSHKTIGEITGRTQALIGCMNGVWLPGTFFAHFFKDYDFAIKHYQIYQEKYGSFLVRIVPTALLNSSISNEIILGLKAYTGQETTVTFELLSEIPLVRTGKRTPVISLLDKDFQDIKPGELFQN
jgi:phenylacetate-CoA ligase